MCLKLNRFQGPMCDLLRSDPHDPKLVPGAGWVPVRKSLDGKNRLEKRFGLDFNLKEI